MKTLVPAVLTCLLTTIAAAQSWETDYKKAMLAARKDNRPLMVEFTGSDWCHYCVKLEKEVFRSREFSRWADKRVALLKLDFPRRRKLKRALREQNDELAKKFGIAAFPTIVFLDHDGRELGRTGYVKGGPSVWTAEADRILDAAERRARDGWLTDYEEALAAARRAGRPILVKFTGSDWCKWCIKLDKEVFSQREFLSWAKYEVILLELDFPKRTQQSDQLRRQNVALRKKHGISAFPTILFLDARGTAIGKTGYLPGGARAWTKSADKILERASARH